MSDETLHHVGFVVASIENAAPGFCRIYGVQEISKIYHDPLQRVYVAFLQPQPPGSCQIELVAPAGPDSTVQGFLEKGGGLHHLCYEVSDLDGRLNEMRARGAMMVRKPKPAVAFGGRRIAWVVTAEKLLIEFLERG